MKITITLETEEWSDLINAIDDFYTPKSDFKQKILDQLEAEILNLEAKV